PVLAAIGGGACARGRGDRAEATPFVPDAVTVSAISPELGDVFGGAPITVTVDRSDGVTGITIGGKPCTNVAVVDKTHLSAVAPPQVGGRHDVVVDTVRGGSAPLAGAYEAWHPTLDYRAARPLRAGSYDRRRAAHGGRHGIRVLDRHRRQRRARPRRRRSALRRRRRELDTHLDRRTHRRQIALRRRLVPREPLRDGRPR